MNRSGWAWHWRRTVALAAALLVGCDPAPESDVAAEAAAEQQGGDGSPASADPALTATLQRSLALADSIEDLLRPVPLMTAAQEKRLRQHLNAAHIARARALGIRAADEAEIRRRLADGSLVRLEDSTRHWIVRRGAAARAIVTPDTRRLLVRIAERFQDHLEERGLPAYRLEVTSVLRTAAGQAALRRRNPNAAAGVSSHEFATTLDIAYEAFAPPSPLPDGLVPGGADGPSRSQLQQVAALALESVSARKSRELTAFLAEVLASMQSEGLVLVILERQQPVFHVTLGRRMEA